MDVAFDSQGRTLVARNREVLTKVKQLFAHKLAGFVSQQSSNILIYALDRSLLTEMKLTR